MTKLLIIFSLIQFKFLVSSVHGRVLEGSIPYGSSCSKDEDCDPYTKLPLYQVNCVKKSPVDLAGVCGCIEDIYEMSPAAPVAPAHVNIRPVLGLGYEYERFNPANPSLGCRRSTDIISACYQGSNSCDMRGLQADDGEAPIVCRDINFHDKSAGKPDFKCVGRERRTRTLGPCTTPHVPGLGVDCEHIPNSDCVDVIFSQTKNRNIRSCLGKPPVGDLLLPAPSSAFVCHHDTDCRDPNAECLPFYSEVILGISYPRSVCLCSETSGYVYSLVNDREKCVLGSSFVEACAADTDCGPVTSDIRCIQLSTTAPNMTCECLSNSSSSNSHEYFEGPYKKEASCEPVKSHAQACSPLFRLNRGHRSVDNCQKRNHNLESTGLKCYESKDIPTCDCAFNAEWSSDLGKCALKYADYNDTCGTEPGLLPCNPRSNLNCRLEPGSTTNRCYCNDNTDKDEDFPYCRARENFVGYGEACDEINNLCDDKLNIVCKLGRCVCLNDEQIVDDGKRCRIKAAKNLSNNFSSIKSTFFILIGTLITNLVSPI